MDGEAARCKSKSPSPPFSKGGRQAGPFALSIPLNKGGARRIQRERCSSQSWIALGTSRCARLET